MDGCVVLMWRTAGNAWSLGNDWDWIKSACRLTGLDYSGFGMLNVTVMQTGLSDVCQYEDGD